MLLALHLLCVYVPPFVGYAWWGGRSTREIVTVDSVLVLKGACALGAIGGACSEEQ